MLKKSSTHKLAFVLSGGGSRGAMQVGALRALIEAGFVPDLVTGTSIGAANAAFLAIHGFTLEGICKLEEIWKLAIDKDLLPSNLWWQFMQVIIKRSNGYPLQKIREFAISSGISPQLKFKDIREVRLYPVAADLDSAQQVIFGLDDSELVLDGVLASMTLPPWMLPVEKDGRYLMDGGAVSTLPVEAAMLQGATEIIALDLFDPNEENDYSTQGLKPFLWKLDKTVENRQIELEIKLVQAHGLIVKQIPLIYPKPVPFWDFRRTNALMAHGHQITWQAIQTWREHSQHGWMLQQKTRSLVEGLVEVLD